MRLPISPPGLLAVKPTGRPRGNLQHRGEKLLRQVSFDCLSFMIMNAVARASFCASAIENFRIRGTTRRPGKFALAREKREGSHGEAAGERGKAQCHKGHVHSVAAINGLEDNSASRICGFRPRVRQDEGSVRQRGQ